MPAADGNEGSNALATGDANGPNVKRLPGKPGEHHSGLAGEQLAYQETQFDESTGGNTSDLAGSSGGQGHHGGPGPR